MQLLKGRLSEIYMIVSIVLENSYILTFLVEDPVKVGMELTATSSCYNCLNNLLEVGLYCNVQLGDGVHKEFQLGSLNGSAQQQRRNLGQL